MLNELSIADAINEAIKNVVAEEEPLRKVNESIERLKRLEEMRNALNKVNTAFLSKEYSAFEDILIEGISKIAEPAKLDRVSVLRNSTMPDGEHASQIYRWDKEFGGTSIPIPELEDFQYSKICPDWVEQFFNNKPINGPVSKMVGGEVLRSFDMISVFVSPVFINKEFWGMVVFEDCQNERYFDTDVEDMLRSAALLFVNIILKEEMEHKAIESEIFKKAQEAEKSTHLMFNSMPLCSWIWSEDLIILDCNQETINLFGLSEKLTTVDLFYKLMPEYQSDGKKSIDVGNEKITEAFAEGFKRFEFLHQTLDGELIPCEVTLFRSQYNGKTVVLSYVHDLREQKKMQAEIEKECQLNKRMAHWYESILDSIPFYLSVQDEDANWVFLNAALEKYIGKKREELIGVPCNQWKNAICDTDECAIACAGRGLTQTHFYDGEISYHVNVNRLTDINGEAAGYMEIIQDVTEMEKLAKEKGEAETANHAKTTFLSNMSHEMRTPMNAIIGMTSIGKNAEDIKHKDYAFGKIEEASKHLLGIINDVLDISKIEANMLELSLIEFDFEHMLHKVISVIRFRMDEKRLKFSINMDDKIPGFVVADDQRLAQVIMNLLSNAIKFTPEDGAVCLDIFMIEEREGYCELRIEVSDTGIGISPEQQEKLFKPFTQAESGTSREYGGTGLGLVISKHIVEMMDGRLWVESELGEGARFIFTVKVVRGEKTIRSLLDSSVNWNTIRILVVDDMEETREYFMDIFDHLNVKCDAAADGFEALRMIHENEGYDICFIDWRMPGMDGIELTKKIKEIKNSKPSVVVMISAYNWENIKGSAMKAGVDKYLVKPLLTSAIIECVNDCLCVNDCEQDTFDMGKLLGKHMLLVEDIEINREIILTILQDTGLEIDCAENGKEALKMLETDPDKYDIIFMDIQMPGMDGFEATKCIRALPRCKEIPIVAMTANVFKEDIERCLAVGMNDHLGKPVDLNMVLDKLCTYL